MTVQEDTEFEWDLRDELLGAIARKLATHERSQQVEIGPSGMGTPCVRKLGYRLAHVPALNDGDPDDIDSVINSAAWRPAVGTELHEFVAGLLEELNAREAASPMHNEGKTVCRAPWCDHDGSKEHSAHKYRYLVEFDVVVGTLNSERKIIGHVDFYDRLKKTVGDWKFPGPAALKRYHAACGRPEDPHPSKEYREQGHIYGRGVSAMGLPVERIANVFIPMNGELRDSFVWSEAFNPEIAKESFRRARIVAEKLRVAKVEDESGESDGRQLDRALAVLKTAPDYCQRCDWFKAGVQHGTTQGCPGDPSIFASGGKNTSAELAELMGED